MLNLFNCRSQTEFYNSIKSHQNDVFAEKKEIEINKHEKCSEQKNSKKQIEKKKRDVKASAVRHAM